MVYVTPPEQSISGSNRTMILLSRVVDERPAVDALGEDCEDVFGVELEFSLETIELANIATHAMIELSSLICAACSNELDVLLARGVGLTAWPVEWDVLLACDWALFCELLLLLNAKDNELLTLVNRLFMELVEISVVDELVVVLSTLEALAFDASAGVKDSRLASSIVRARRLRLTSLLLISGLFMIISIKSLA